jgi:hypothetical protein
MKKLLFATLGTACLITTLLYAAEPSKEIKAEDCFFLSSLHYTARGMDHWYSKENGGLEVLTGIPYSELGCKNCHPAGCDRCHKIEMVEKDCCIAQYSTSAARNQTMCLKCHGRQGAMIAINHEAEQEDVHLLQGMECMDCHSKKEMHGDGTDYVSSKQPGAMDTQCENCHDEIKPTNSHTVHQDKLECKACHLRHVVSCTNCHFDTLVKEGKRKAIPVSGWLFLMNYRGKVSSASMQTFVTQQSKTFLMFAPHMSHAVTKEGRKCDDCHGTDTMKQAQKGKIKLTWLSNGKLENLKGVIPVLDNVDYECSYQDFKAGQWVPIRKPDKPVRQYVAFGSPLTKEQLESLVAVQEVPPPQMK